jgi:proteasome lid subunit RPN8/RPN11
MYKLLIKFPTRGRKEKFFRVLDKYYELLDDPKNTEFCITIDEDDSTMNNDEVLDKLETYQNLFYYIGNSKSKIEAINADLEDFDDFNILLLASDDMIPQIKGYDTIIKERMSEFFQDTDGVLWFFDGNRKDLNTLCILGKKYYDRFGYIYHPGYKSFYCDNEFTQVANKLGKQKFVNVVIIKHEHPDIPMYRTEMDEMYMKNHKYYPVDAKFFQLRQKNNFGIR